jgi:class 3 adenylate cyclase
LTQHEQPERRPLEGTGRQLEQAIAALEAQRDTLGDAVVDAMIAAARKELAVLERTAAPELAMEGERKLVTVMFADISGFTALAETMDPEAVRDRMNACFEQLVPVVEKYEGTLDKFIGDEIMALFGAGGPRERPGAGTPAAGRGWLPGRSWLPRCGRANALNLLASPWVLASAVAG